MRVEELIIDGFKSYATRTVISGWDNQFNAITGLNGSGKSNILDAICFVLGISNLSCVRATNLQELVYKKGQAGINKASVTIVFNNEDKAKSPIGYENCPKISITRQVIIGGKNKYLINGHNAQQQAVANLFQSVSLNVNNPHFLIMQGKITKVLNMKPPEILAMIEEAAGTRMFEERKDKALKTIGKKEKKLEDIAALLNEEITPKLDKYRKEKRSYLEFQKISSELDQLRRLHTAFEYTSAQTKLNKFDESVEAKTRQLEEWSATIESLQSRLVEVESLIQQVSSKKSSEMGEGGRFAELEALVKEAGKHVVKIKAKCDNVKKTIAEDNTNLKTLKESEEELLQSIQESKQKTTQLNATFESSKLDHDDKIERLRESEELLQTLTTGMASSEGTETGYMEQLKLAKADVSNCTTEIESSKLKMKHATTELKTVASKVGKAAKEVESLNAEIENMTRVVESLKAQLAKLSYDPTREAELQSRKRQLVTQMEALQEQIDELSSRVSSVQFNYTDPTPHFDRSKVKGLVAELVSIPQEYLNASTALEIAAGSRIYNVVVETEVVGSQLLQNGRLKKRVTIIPLNKISAFKVSKQKISLAENAAPGKVHLALNLIGYDDEVFPAMEYIFGSTLICADKESAQKVTFDPSIRMKSVTLEGDVYDPSGTLSGGSAPNSSGLLVKMARLRDLKLQRAAIKEQLAKVDEELSALTAFSSKVGKLSSDLQLKEHALGLLHTQLAKSTYKQLLDQQTELNKTIEEARATIQSSTERQQVAQRKCAQIEKDMKEYADHRESKLASIRNQISLLKKSLDDSSKAYNVFQKQLQVLGCEIETFEKDLVKVREQLAQAEGVRVGHVQELEALEKELAGVQQSHEEASRQLAKEQELLAKYDSELKRLEKEKKSTTRQCNELDLSRTELTRELERMESDRKTCQRVLQELDQLHDWIASQKHLFGAAGTSYDFGAYNIQEVKKRLSQLEEKHNSLKKNINEKAMEMIDRMEKKEKSLKSMLDTVKKDKSKIENTISSLDEYKREALYKTWEKVNKDFGAILGELFPGNTAKLTPPEGQDITQGLEVKVCLGGVWKESLTELSGGQRSLIALSLILSLLQFKPAPMYILDEVDAALDLSHTQNIGHLLRTRFGGAQFIVVSLKEGLFNNANVLFRARFRDGVSVVERFVLRNKGLERCEKDKERENQAAAAAKKAALVAARSKRPLVAQQ